MRPLFGRDRTVEKSDDERLYNPYGAPRLGHTCDTIGREPGRRLRSAGVSGRAQRHISCCSRAVLAPRSAVYWSTVHWAAVSWTALFRPAARVCVRPALGATAVLREVRRRRGARHDHHGGRRRPDPVAPCSGPVLVLGRSLPLSRLLGLLLLIPWSSA